MANGDPDDCSLEEEVTLAMEEILEKEKDYKNLIEVTLVLFERSQELQVKMEDSSSQMQMIMGETSRLEETNN